MAFLNETGLQELRARLEAVYARKANITAGTAGETTDTSGSSITIPYVTMNAQGVVTGYGTKTHTVPVPTSDIVSAPIITYSQESKNDTTDHNRPYKLYRHKITITRTYSSGVTYYSGSNVPTGSFTGSSSIIYSNWTTLSAGNTVTWAITADTRVDGKASALGYATATTSASVCTCNCSCDCGCDCRST